MHRLHHARFGLTFTNFGTQTVVHPVGDHGPAVIQTRSHHVDLVTALRSVLVGPKLAGYGVQRSALHVAIAQRPFFVQGPCLPCVGVVGRHTPVVMQANDRAGMVVQFLGSSLITPIAKGQVQHPGLVNHNASAEVMT